MTNRIRKVSYNQNHGPVGEVLEEAIVEWVGGGCCGQLLVTLDDGTFCRVKPEKHPQGSEYFTIEVSIDRSAQMDTEIAA